MRDRGRAGRFLLICYYRQNTQYNSEDVQHGGVYVCVHVCVCVVLSLCVAVYLRRPPRSWFYGQVALIELCLLLCLSDTLTNPLCFTPVQSMDCLSESSPHCRLCVCVCACVCVCVCGWVVMVRVQIDRRGERMGGEWWRRQGGSDMWG